MREVTCSACDNYCVVYEDITDLGLCLIRKKKVLDLDKVREDFIIRRGLHTKREIPSYCKNYNKAK